MAPEQHSPTAGRARTLSSLAYAYRLARNAAYRLLNPLDALFLRINRLGQYPPIYLRRHAGCLGGFDGSGYEFVSYLKLLTGLAPEHRLWDVGCGCGLLELALESAGWQGQLIGVDIHKPSVQWAQRAISRHIPSFRFVHADIQNPAYWPQGRMSADQWFFSFQEREFDRVIAKSLFTHMQLDELDIYLREIHTRLKLAGKALLTFFLLNPEQDKLQYLNKIVFTKPDGASVYAVRNPAAPTAAVAYEENFLVEHLQGSGLLVEVIRYGTWSGRGDGLSFQDLIVVSKR